MSGSTISYKKNDLSVEDAQAYAEGAALFLIVCPAPFMPKTGVVKALTEKMKPL